MGKTLKKSLSFVLSLTMLVSTFIFLPFGKDAAFASQVPESKPIPNGYYLKKESLQPYGTSVQVDELKNWSPDNDPDARYNRGSVPLKDRYMGPLVNANASPDAKVMSLAMSNPRVGEAKSQGGEGINQYAFTYFQYVDTYNYWGGSTHDGIIAIPTPEHIDSAHKNGVKATGTIFFPWGDSEFVGKAMTQFTEQDKNGKFIIADKLFEIAEYYGFDGFFINQESSVSSALAAKLRDMLAYIQENKPENFTMQWYDSMVPTGGISNQNGINQNNIGMIQDGERRINDEAFLNFNWNKSRIDTSIDTMLKAGRSPYDVFASWEYFPYSKDPGRVEHLVDNNNKIRTSIGLLSPTVTLTNAVGPEDFQNVQESKLWVGSTSDPTDTTRVANQFPGVSSIVADRTPIVGSNFVTHFTAGNGYKFYENGVVTGKKEWYNRSLTDVMPTWRWIVESKGAKLSPKIDYADAYFAGTSLKIEGKLEAANPNHIKLYSSKLDINSKSSLSITYKTKSAANNLQVGLGFGDTYADENFVFFDVKDGEAGKWNTVTIDLSAYAGKTAKAISLKLASKTDVKDFEINVGRLAITDNAQAPAKIQKATFDEIMFEDYAHAEARIYWDQADDAALYTIHRVKADGTKEFIGATPNNAYYIAPFEKDGDESGFNFEITPITENGIKGSVKSLHFKWSIPDNTSEFIDRTVRENLALNKPAVSNVAVENDGPVHNINDGVITLSKWCTKGSATVARPHFATIDLGEEKEISRWVVHHANAPGAGESPDMNTIDFKLRYAPDDGLPLLDGDTTASKNRVNNMTFKDADTVTDNRLDITDRNLNTPIKARYVQLYVTNSDRSPWKATRVYEFQVYAEKFDQRTAPINMQFVKAKNNEGATDKVTVSNVTAGDTVNLYEDLATKTVLATAIAPASGIVEFTNLDFGDHAGRIYYAVKNPNYMESVRRSVPFDAAQGEKISVLGKEDFSLLRSLKGAQLANAKRYGILTLKNLPEGAQIEIFENEKDTFPILLSAPAVDGAVIQERIPLRDTDGKFFIEIKAEGKRTSDRFAVNYDLANLPGDMSGLKDTIAKYSKLKEDKYLSNAWIRFNNAMKEGKAILANSASTPTQLAEAQAAIKAAAVKLLRKGDLSDLINLYNTHKEKQESQFMVEGWVPFKQALDHAERIITKNDSSPIEVKAAESTLKDAASGLVEAKLEEVTLVIDHDQIERTKTAQLRLIGQLNNGYNIDINIADAEFSIDNPAVATVDENGIITALQEGSAEITATVKKGDSVHLTNRITITVVPLVNEKVAKVIEQINNLPELADLTLADKEVVNDCKVAYNKLHPTLREQVTNYDRLVQAMERMQELKKNFNNGNN
ncbi:Ig-like domain-containing protein [Neobacillus sp. NPDC058068]|uniref:endo-beta-N-acetylglucosaminidase n=1 Tax=Neobacillus sp. NPDC058068 TaxID=3346325 RepID=UPI0036DC8A29